ncbi:unnamed protein product [Sphagnum troendelagicum]|uniref:GDSL esterase/lipase n=1 Tax=Sphagnum troendelagicum TaxID=128251 RepID=A0ABP0TIJ7_9BRYO
MDYAIKSLPLRHKHLRIFLSSLTGLAAKVQKSSTATPALVPASFVFGDSLVDAGNNNYIRSLARANYPANGIDFPGHVPTGRFTNNRTVADIVGQLLGLPSFVPVFMNPTTKGKVILQGVNYASGGAGILDFTGYAFIHRIPMWQQIKNFQNTSQQIMQILGPSAGATLIKNSVFSITMGANDYLNNYLVVASPTPHLYNPQNFQNLLISTFKQQLLMLIESGARKFVISNVGALGCTPYRMTTNKTIGGTCVQSDNTLVSGFNTALKSLIDQLNRQFPRAKFILANAFDVLLSLRNNPATNGFSTVDQACCGVPIGPYHGLTPCFPGVAYCANRGQHLFWDPYHPTDAANVIIANRFFTGPPADIYPINIKALAALSMN